MLKNYIDSHINLSCTGKGTRKIKMFYEEDAEKLLFFTDSGIYHWQEEAIFLRR
jgi:hypothetical protein